MAGFRKAKAEQAALKIGMYGPPGSGKTLTALMCAEGLAKLSKKRIAMVDTEHGSDFYCQALPARKVHPEAIDFDAIYTRSISEVIDAVTGLNPNDYGVVIIDSITHIWASAQAAYVGKMTRVDTVPFHAWKQIKKPYKHLIDYLLSSPMHMFLCGRQGNEFEENEDTGEMKKVGVKMKAEGETPHEPHVLIRMEQLRKADGGFSIRAVPEKDRSSILSGSVIVMEDTPGFAFDRIVKPLLPLLGDTQAVIDSEDETSAKDASAFAEADAEREATSQITLEEFKARIQLAKATADLKTISKEITPELKKNMLPAHVTELREAYLEKEKKLK